MQCNGELIVGNVSTAFESNASESCGTGVGNSVRPGVRTGGRWIKYFDGDIQQQQVIMDGPAQQRLTGVDIYGRIWGAIFWD